MEWLNREPYELLLPEWILNVMQRIQVCQNCFSIQNLLLHLTLILKMFHFPNYDRMNVPFNTMIKSVDTAVQIRNKNARQLKINLEKYQPRDHSFSDIWTTVFTHSWRKRIKSSFSESF